MKSLNSLISDYKKIEFLGFNTERSNVINLLIIILISIAVGLIYGLFSLKNIDDADGFAWLSKYLADHNGFAPTMRRGPMFLIVFGAFIKLFGFSTLVTVIFQTLFLTVLGCLTYIFSFKLFHRFKYALLTSLLVVCNPMCFNFVAKNLVELVFAVLILLQIWYAYMSIIQPKYKNYILFGVLSALSALCKSVTLLFPFFFVISILLFHLFKVSVFKNLTVITLFKFIIVSTIAMFLTIMPWTIRNYKVSGKYTLISTGAGFEFLRGKHIAQENAYIELNKTNDYIWDKFYIEYNGILDKYKLKDEVAINIKLDEIMKDYIINNPLGFVERTLKQIPTFWMRGENLPKSLVYLFLSVSLIFFFILGFIRIMRKSVFGYILIISAVYFNLIYAAILAIGRYSMPLYPPMYIVGVVGLVYLYNKIFNPSVNSDVVVYPENSQSV
jgi:4-amino-4-deoxy-L-arabinose transferase-like glycosyltransferase